eukprot:7342267-Prorocentrum_lima.AAC.1
MSAFLEKVSCFVQSMLVWEWYENPSLFENDSVLVILSTTKRSSFHLIKPLDLSLSSFQLEHCLRHEP